jgi:hypothetical protein
MRTSLLLAGSMFLFSACQAPTAAQAPASAPTAPLALPASASSDPLIAPLAFLSGRWMCVNPNTTVNEELWTLPLGKSMVGSFRQVRRDGGCAFVEVSQIAVEDGELVLRLRHLHGKLEVPPERAELSLFKLRKLTGERVEFAGTGSAEGVTAVIYERADATTLRQTIEFDPVKTKEKPFTSTYTLVR